MREDTRHVDEGTIHAWLDDALPATERAAVELHVASCAECAAAVAEARGLIAASARILSALDDVPAGVIPNATPASVARIVAAAADRPVPAAAPTWTVRRYAPLAAAAVIVIVGSVVWRRDALAPTPAATVSPTAALQSDVAPAAGPNAEAVVPAPQPAAPSLPPTAGKERDAIAAPKAQSVAPSLQEAQRTTSRGFAAGATDELAKDARVRGAVGGAPAPVAQRAIAAGAAAPLEMEKKAVTDVASANVVRKSEDASSRLEVAAPAPPAARRDDAEQGARQKAAAPARSADAKLRGEAGGVSGVVLDAATGRPLPGASVTIRGTSQGAVTNAAGEFFIAGVPAGSQLLAARQIGFRADSQRVAVTNERAASVTLSLAAEQVALEGVVVTSRADSSGAAFSGPPRSIEGLMLVSSATSRTATSVIRRSVYDVRPGVQVTLVETRPLLADKSFQASRDQARNSAVAPTGPTPPATVSSLRWTARDGAEMSLSGPLSAAELAAIRARVP